MSSTFSPGRSVAAAAVFSVCASACSKAPPPMQTPEVTVAPVVQRVVADWDDFTGHFEAVNSVEVRPRARVSRYRPSRSWRCGQRSGRCVSSANEASRDDALRNNHREGVGLEFDGDLHDAEL